MYQCCVCLKKVSKKVVKTSGLTCLECGGEIDFIGSETEGEARKILDYLVECGAVSDESVAMVKWILKDRGDL